MSLHVFQTAQSLPLAPRLDTRHVQVDSVLDEKQLQTHFNVDEKETSNQSSRPQKRENGPKKPTNARADSLPLDPKPLQMEQQSQTWPMIAPSGYEPQLEAASVVANGNDYSLERWLGVRQAGDEGFEFTQFGYNCTTTPPMVPEQSRSELVIDTKYAGYWDPSHDWNMTDVTDEAANFHFYPENLDFDCTAPYDQVYPAA